MPTSKEKETSVRLNQAKSNHSMDELHPTQNEVEQHNTLMPLE
jgi:hypothetical protein